MAIYIILWSVVIICCLAECRYDKVTFGNIHIDTRKVTFFIIFIFILLLGVFRNESLGVDQQNYYISYYSYGKLSLGNILSRWLVDDIGYFLLGKIFYVCGASFYVFKSALFIIVMILFGSMIFTQSEFPAFSFLILLGTGFLGIHFTLLRMSLAIAICFVSFRFVERKRFWKFLILVLIAALFHKSALFFVLVYLFVHVSFSGMDLWKKVVILAIAIIASFTVVPYLYIFYARNDYSDSVISGSGVGLLIFYIIVAAFHTYFYHRRLRREEEEKRIEDSIMEASTWSSVYMQIEATAFSVLSRVVYYFSSLLSITLSGLLKPRKGRWTVLIVYLVLFSVMYFRLLIGNGYNIVPYISTF